MDWSYSWSGEPAFSQFHAFSLLLIYCFAYVLPLYATSATRATSGRSRDAPEAIRARIRSVTYSTALCSLATFALIQLNQRPPKVSPWALMGYWPIGMVETCKSMVLIGLLFLGPLYECLLIEGAWRSWVSLNPLKQVWSDWAAWRNLVAGPVTEECLFRSSAVPLLLMAGCSMKSIIYMSPMVFGLAHLHHFYEFRVTHPQIPLAAAILRSLLQFSYTTVFGVYATFLFLRTGSLLAVITVHTFCNTMGFPRVWGQLQPYWLQDESTVQVKPELKWTILYYLLLLGGLVLWWQNLLSLTRSPAALVTWHL